MMTTTASWNDLSEKEQLESIFWDAYKDAFGIRPRFINFPDMSVEELQKELDSLSTVIQQQERNRLAEENEAADQVERTILNLMQAGAKDRDMAVRWLMEANEANGDKEYLCFLLGVSYGYFN
jgi:thymidylate synthase